MSQVQKALDSVQLAAARIGGMSKLVERVNADREGADKMNLDTARRLVRDIPTPLRNLMALELVAAEVLGERP